MPVIFLGRDRSFMKWNDLALGQILTKRGFTVYHGDNRINWLG